MGFAPDDIEPSDWRGVQGWKCPSLVWSSLDADLRPHEVAHARVGWVDLDNQLLRIPVDESVKNEENWHVALTEATTNALDARLAQRNCFEMYDETDRLWLTREANPLAPTRSASCSRSSVSSRTPRQNIVK